MKLTMNDIGLNEEISPISDVVIESVTHTQPTLVRSSTGSISLFYNKQNPTFTGYALNFIQSYIYEFDHKFIGISNGKYKFIKEEISFTYNGISYYIPAQELTIWNTNLNKWTFKIKTFNKTYRLLFNRKFQDFSAEDLAKHGKISVDELYEKLSSYYYGVEKSPLTHITSVFVKINKTNNEFRGQTYVNLQPITSGYGTKITSYNKTGISYAVRWKLYNGCTKENAISGGYEAGNFGLCELRQGAAYTEINPQVFSWDESREYVVIECQIEELPAQGKNFTVSGYYTIKGADIDDPIGQSFRLPRKPVSS